MNNQSSTDTTPPADLADRIEDLAQWADAAVGFFPVHGGKFKEIARVLRAGVAQALPEDVRIPLHGLQADVDYLIGRVVADGSCGSMIAASIKEKLTRIEKGILGDAQAALNPGMREALERIRDFPIGGHTAAGAMALIARQALATGE